MKELYVTFQFTSRVSRVSCRVSHVACRIFLSFLRHAHSPTSRPHKPTNLTCRRVPLEVKDFHLGYLMVASCPPVWNDTETARACCSTDYSADPLTALPVLDITTNITYANTYCAMCHGKSHDLHLWSLKFSTPRFQHPPSLREIQSTRILWEAIPAWEHIPDRCISTPIESRTHPDTKLKQFCRAYANAVIVNHGAVKRVIKNPHCAFMAGYNVLPHTRCGSRFFGARFRPFLRTTLFTFSVLHVKQTYRNTQRVRVEFNCSLTEVYDPFKEQCMPVATYPHPPLPNYTNITEYCQGPHFAYSEFRILSNNSVFLRPHQKIYPNGSYIRVNQTIILCLNVSRNYTRSIWTSVTGNESKPEARSLTLHILTYVGFSLSIIALLFLLFTYFLFAELRTYPGKAIMHLSCAMIAMQLVYFATDPDVVSSAVCAVMGALLHYFILAVFFWMSAIAHNTQKTFRNPGRYRFVCFSSLQYWVYVKIYSTCVLMDQSSNLYTLLLVGDNKKKVLNKCLT